MNDEVADALLAAAYEWWTKPGSIPNRTSWTTEGAVALMAEGPPEENKGELGVCMPCGFPEDTDPAPQSVADGERSQYKVAWHEATKIEWGGHKTTGTYEAAILP